MHEPPKEILRRIVQLVDDIDTRRNFGLPPKTLNIPSSLTTELTKVLQIVECSFDKYYRIILGEWPYSRYSITYNSEVCSPRQIGGIWWISHATSNEREKLIFIGFDE